MRASSSGRPMPPAPSRSRRAHALAAASPSRTAARSRGPPRCRASRDMARAMSGAARSGSAQVLAQRLVLAQEADRVEPRGDRARIAQRARRAARPARARRGRSPCGRWRRAGCPAARPRASAAAPGWPGRRVDDEAVGGPGAARRRAGTGCLPICVSSTYLSSAPTAASSAREKAPKACRSATPSCALSRRSPARLSKEAPATGVAAAPAMPIHLAHAVVGEQPVGGDHLARREAHDLAGEVGRRHLAHLELAGRDVERGERDQRPRPRRRALGPSNRAVR